MSKLIAIDASPNTRSEDISLAFKLLLSPFNWGGDSYYKKVEEYFKDNYKPQKIILTQSGRLALYLLLKSLVKKDDEVITQAFTCLAVPNAILWAGGKPVFVDIEKGTYNIDPKDLVKKITKKTRAVIIQHTFGLPGNVEEIRSICRYKGIILLEDCAHALGAKIDSKLVGTFGDGAIFSFNQDKIVSGVSGGVMLINNPDLIANFPENIQLKRPSFLETFKALLHPLLWGVAIPIYDTLSLGKALIFLGWKIGILGNTITPEEQKGQMPNGILKRLSEPQLQLVLKGLERLERDNKRRKDIALRYRKELRDLVTHPTELKSTEPAYLRYPILVEDPAKVLQMARKNGIILGRWYLTPVFPWTTAAKQVYQMGECPLAEEAGKHVVNLPTYPRLTDEEVTRIINVVKKTYGNN